MNCIAIFGAPRSGTSWLGQMFNSSPHVAYRFQPLFSYSFKGAISDTSSTNEINGFYNDLLNTKDSFILQEKNVSEKESLAFFKDEIKHIVWKEVRYHFVIENLLEKSSTKIIGIVRHPCSVIWSWANAPKEFNAEWDLLNEWQYAEPKNLNRREEYNGYEKWKELAFAYMYYEKKYANNFITVKYESLNEQTEIVMKRLFEFCEVEWQSQTERFIADSKALETDDAYSVFRNNKTNNEWVAKLPAQIEHSILNDPDFIKLNEYFKWNNNVEAYIIVK